MTSKEQVKLMYVFLIHYNVQAYTTIYLPARTSEQGNVIGSVRVYICVQNYFVYE